MKILRSKKEPETVFQCMTCPHPKPLDRCRTARIELFPALPSLSPRRNTAAANPPYGETPLDETRRGGITPARGAPSLPLGEPRLSVRGELVETTAPDSRGHRLRHHHQQRFSPPPNHGGAVSRSGISLSLSLSAGSEGDRCSRTRSGRLSGPDATAPRETSTSRLAHFCFAFWLMEKIRLVYPAKSSR